MNYFSRVLCVAVLAAWVAGAHAAVVELAWKKVGAREVFSYESRLAEKKVGEVCGALKKGESVKWRFSASAPVDFNIHMHAGKEVEYFNAAKAIRSDEGMFVAPVDQDFCWMWLNREKQEVSFSVDFSR